MEVISVFSSEWLEKTGTTLAQKGCGLCWNSTSSLAVMCSTQWERREGSYLINTGKNYRPRPECTLHGGKSQSGQGE